MNSAFDSSALEDQATHFAREIAGLKAAMTRSARRQRFGTALLAICSSLVGFQIAHGDSAGTFTAPFNVVDESGQKIFDVVKLPSGINVMRLYNPQGKIVVAGATAVDGTGRVGVSDPSTEDFVAMVGEHSNVGAFSLLDREGKSVVDAFRGSKGGQGLAVYDQRGDLRVQMMVGSDGNTQISEHIEGSSAEGIETQIALIGGKDYSRLIINDSIGDEIASLGDERGPVDANDPAAKANYTSRGLFINGPMGNGGAAVRLTEAGAGDIRVYDIAGNTSGALIASDRDGGKVALRDAAGIGVQAELNGREGLKLYGAGAAPIAGVYRTAAGGEIQLSTPAGQTIVEAKADPDGRGLLGVGPTMRVDSIMRGYLK
ncbi:MAG: hypothetical protein ABI640_15860 [Gammaproteobacteria bacterium]